MSLEQTALSLYQLLGAPLYALIQAETFAANATVEFIENVGFEAPQADADKKEATDDLGKLRTLTFRQERRDASGQAASYKVEVPLLSMLPIPALQIREADLEFFVKIVDMTTQSRAARSGRSAETEQPAAETEQPAAKAEQPAETPEPPGSRLLPLPGYLDMKAMLGRGQPNAPRSPESAFDMQVYIKIKLAQADPPAGLSRVFNLLEQGVSSTRLEE